MIKLNRTVSSREYKLMLNTDRFLDRNQGAKNFFALIEILVRKAGGRAEFLNGEKRRQVSYFDTPQFALRQNGFSLRLREENNSFKLNLKCRNADRYISASKDLTSPTGDKIEFEEDILPPFYSKFSHSNTLKTIVMPELKIMKDVFLLFPLLKELSIDENTPVETANDLRVLEVVRDICTIQFETPVTVEASLSFWYLEDETDFPIVGEFSFKYKATKGIEDQPEEYSIRTAIGANDFFRALQNQSGWVDFNNTTKTAFALDVL